MSDLINREKALDIINKLPKRGAEGGGVYVRINDVFDAIESLPSEDRPKGHIVTNCNGTFYHTVWAECSECGKPIGAWDKFCRHCGAKMEEKSD